MKNRLMSALPFLNGSLALAVLLCMAACDEGGQEPDPTQTEAGGPAIWQVDGTAYLLGTIHAGYDATDLPDEIIESFVASDAYWSESDLSLTPPNMLASDAARLEGTRLDELLPEETWARLVAFGATLGASEEMLQSTAPWAIALYLKINILSPPLFSRVKPTLMDHQLRIEAEGRGMTLEFLETHEELWGNFATEPMERPIADIIDFLELMDDQELLEARIGEEVAVLESMAEAFAVGDIASLLTASSCGEDNSENRALLSARNASWLPAFQRAMASPEREFIAVGVCHLVGLDNLVEVLRSEGHSVARIEL